MTLHRHGGLVPAIHAAPPRQAYQDAMQRHGVDGRDKPPAMTAATRLAKACRKA